MKYFHTLVTILNSLSMPLHTTVTDTMVQIITLIHKCKYLVHTIAKLSETITIVYWLLQAPHKMLRERGNE